MKTLNGSWTYSGPSPNSEIACASISWHPGESLPYRTVRDDCEHRPEAKSLLAPLRSEPLQPGVERGLQVLWLFQTGECRQLGDQIIDRLALRESRPEIGPRIQAAGLHQEGEEQLAQGVGLRRLEQPLRPG